MAVIICEENRICELVSLILEDLGFKSTPIIQDELLVETVLHANPELIVWDLDSGKKLGPFQSFSQMREQNSMKQVKILFVGGPGVKKVVEPFERDTNVHFCLKPFSPARFRHEMGELFGAGYVGAGD